MIFKIRTATYKEVVAQEEALRRAFGMALLDDKNNGLSLRAIAEKRNCSHETARRLINKAQTEQPVTA